VSVSPLTEITLYLLSYGNRDRYVPRFMQQYLMIENENVEEDCVKISLCKNLEQYLRKLAGKNLITLVEDEEEDAISPGKSFHGIRVVQIDFRKITLLKKEMKKFYESEKKNIFQSQNTTFPRSNDSDIKNIFERSSSFFPKIMQYFGFLKKKREKRFVVGLDREFHSTAVQYIKV